MNSPVSRAGVLATIAAAMAVIAVLITLGLPSRARERRLDGLRVDDLVQLSSSLDAYWSKHAALPLALDSLVSARQTDRIPSDPATNLHSWRHGAGESCFDLTVTPPSKDSK